MHTLSDIQSYIKTIKIKTSTGIIIPSLNSPQLSWMCNWINMLSTVDVKSRQIGGTTAQTIFASYIATNEPKSNILIRSHNMHKSRIILFLIRCILESRGEQFDVKNNNQLILSNGSNITTLYYPSINYRLVFLDELGYTVNYIIPFESEQIIIQSTATLKETFFSRIVHSTKPMIGEHSMDLITFNPWNVLPRTPYWKENLINNIGLEFFDCQYNCKFGY